MSVIRTAADAPRPKATAAKVSGILSDGKWHRIGASFYGRADSGGLPACGGGLSGPTWWAELSNGSALGGLPCGTKIDIKGPSGVTLTGLPRRDTGAHNPPVGGVVRGVDVWNGNGAAARLGLVGPGVAVCEVRLSTGDTAGGGDSFGGDTAGELVTKRYEFTRGEKGGKRENSWDAMGRLAEEVAWSRWAAQNVLGYASQDELIAGPVGVELTGDEGFVLDEPQWSWSPKRPVEELTLHVAADRWEVMPGGVALFTSGRPFDGRWLVSKVSGDSLDSPVVEVTFKRPTHKKAEPANETATKSVDTGDSGTGATGGPLQMSGTPKEIIDKFVLPIGRRHNLNDGGAALTPGNVTSKNAAHGPTTAGGRSDHQGPPSTAWAVDMGNGWLTGQEWACASELAELFGLSNPFKDKQGRLVNGNVKGYHVQIIFGLDLGPSGGGEHRNHVHCGIHRGG